MSAGAFGPLTLLLIACFASFGARSALATARGLASGVRVASATGPAPTLPAVVGPPVVALCHTVMAIFMVYLLLAMR
jgi:hypothetical protein